MNYIYKREKTYWEFWWMVLDGRKRYKKRFKINNCHLKDYMEDIELWQKIVDIRKKAIQDKKDIDEKSEEQVKNLLAKK